jgi:hypothetical protein
MSSREIQIDGISYTRSREAARAVPFTSAHISRLARAELIEGRLVNGLWFINLTSLQHFIAHQERQKEQWRAELARTRREEQRRAGHPSAFAA